MVCKFKKNNMCTKDMWFGKYLPCDEFEELMCMNDFDEVIIPVQRKEE